VGGQRNLRSVDDYKKSATKILVYVLATWYRYCDCLSRRPTSFFVISSVLLVFYIKDIKYRSRMPPPQYIYIVDSTDLQAGRSGYECWLQQLQQQQKQQPLDTTVVIIEYCCHPPPFLFYQHRYCNNSITKRSVMMDHNPYDHHLPSTRNIRRYAIISSMSMMMVTTIQMMNIIIE
jgi:hypothetical protein